MPLSVGVLVQFWVPHEVPRIIDFVVRRGRTPTARQLLRASSDFEVEARTNHTLYKAAKPVEIEILAPPALFQEIFDEKTKSSLWGI